MKMTYGYTMQLTCSNVVSTIVTTRPTAQRDERPRGGTNIVVGGVPPSPVSNQEPQHVYAQGCNPKKVKRKGRYQAQLPAFRRSLPALPIPVHRLNEELRKERDAFMKQLHKERMDKFQLETWAATKIQAVYRGFHARPRVISYKTRQRFNTIGSIRLDLTGMQETLEQASPRRAGSPTKSVSLVKEGSPDWRTDIRDRANMKKDVRTRKERMNQAATRIQSCIRRFLARLGFRRRLHRRTDEIYLRAILTIQKVFRGYALRSKILRAVAKLQSESALQIQSLIRGIQARERVCVLMFEKKCDEKRQAGEPLQFTLPPRFHSVQRFSPIKVLYEHRKTKASLEFKSAKWREDRLYLAIHVRINRSISCFHISERNHFCPCCRKSPFGCPAVDLSCCNGNRSLRTCRD
ncbi:TPA: hypothetical protein N0F65_008171 [Lagenidium giganteum]|uniref:Uncharacterized protein n=1 Tax=Lagenidium giganteum TaxID=4803 RepID=A0AAV2YNF4_9STRA|nr:TPA: hypothetical protein N0F65_008171 [Lagenidium giganteum]